MSVTDASDDDLKYTIKAFEKAIKALKLEL